MTDQAPRTTGTATSRARYVRPAVRRPTKARLAVTGPSGSGKTWTALSVAEVLAPGGRVLVIDTERGDDGQGAAELYADQFSFSTLEWLPPYDPRDLAITLDDLSALPEDQRPDVVIVDSASHFWIGEGGTLDIVDGRFGGWKVGTPVQDEMVNAFMRSGFHLIVLTRAKQDYLVEEGDRGKQKVTKVGLAPVQRDALEYEFQVVIQMDMDHRIAISKTRAQPLAGGSWPAGQQSRFAATYKDWLDRGVTLARPEDVEVLREVIRTAELGADWAAAGWPRATMLDVDRLVEAWAWVGQQLGIDPHPFVVTNTERCGVCDVHPRARWHVRATNPVAEEVHPEAPAEPEPDPLPPAASSEPPEQEPPAGAPSLADLSEPQSSGAWKASPFESPAATQARREGRQGDLAPDDDPRQRDLEAVAASLAP